MFSFKAYAGPRRTSAEKKQVGTHSNTAETRGGATRDKDSSPVGEVTGTPPKGPPRQSTNHHVAQAPLPYARMAMSRLCRNPKMVSRLSSNTRSWLVSIPTVGVSRSLTTLMRVLGRVPRAWAA